MNVSIFLPINVHGTMYGPIFIAIYKIKEVAIVSLLGDKKFVDMMKKCKVRSDDTYVKRMISKSKYLHYRNDEDVNSLSLICVTKGNVSRNSIRKFISVNNKGKKLYCIFDIEFKKWIGATYGINDITYELIMLNNIEEYSVCYGEFYPRYNKHGWWYYLDDDEMGCFMCFQLYIGDGKYRYTKEVFGNEVMICKDKQRDIDFIERIGFLLSV
jgi:hypothetical protein